MMIGVRSALTSFVVGLAVVAGSFSSLAQEPSAKKSTEKAAPAPASAPAAKKKGDPSRRVPAYFGQVGLTSEQRESIYKIRKSHQDKIDALKKQITDAEAKSLAECEAVLTDTQKKLVENLRAGAEKTSK
jgi:hypothetical protein